MTPEERELIAGVAEFLRAADRSGKDPDAERLIRETVAGQPDAAYLLTQRVIVAELALKRAEARLAELEGRPGGQGFLPGSAGGQLPVARRVDQGYAAGPPAAAPGSGVGSFLKTAAAAAAGTIAAELIYDGLRHVVSGGPGAGWVPPAPHWGGPMPRPEPDDRPVAPGPADPFDLSGSESAGGPDAAGGDWGDAGPGGDFAGGDFGEPADEPDPGDVEPADDGGDFGGGDFGDVGDSADPGDAGGGDW